MERWVVSPVAQPILAAGKLLKQGWRLIDFDDLGLCLTSPSREAQIPVRFNNNTLVCTGVVRAISEAEPLKIQAVKVRLSGLLDRLLDNAEFFQEIAPGVHATTLTSRHHVAMGQYPVLSRDPPPLLQTLVTPALFQTLVARHCWGTSNITDRNVAE